MKANNITMANLKGMAKHTYNRVMSAMAEDKNNKEYIDKLRYELQEYHNNTSKGGANRKKFMAMLAEDIARLEAAETSTTATTVETSELTHAGQCLDLYLRNTAEIYKLYTAPVISELVKKDRNNGGRTNWDNVINNLCHLDACEPLCTLESKICRAIDRARRLVRQYDGLRPTAQDIKQVTRDYVAYIVDCVKYEIKTT